MIVCLHTQRSINNADSSFIHTKQKWQQPKCPSAWTLLINKIQWNTIHQLKRATTEMHLMQEKLQPNVARPS